MLDRIITLTLATNDISFRGHREHETKSKGELLVIIVGLLIKYEPVPLELLRKPQESIKYLSRSLQNEIIISLGEKI